MTLLYAGGVQVKWAAKMGKTKMFFLTSTAYCHCKTLCLARQTIPLTSKAFLMVLHPYPIAEGLADPKF